ncbi:hypothetical protein ACFX1T_005517 [Malus domestica]
MSGPVVVLPTKILMPMKIQSPKLRQNRRVKGLGLEEFELLQTKPDHREVVQDRRMFGASIFPFQNIEFLAPQIIAQLNIKKRSKFGDDL